MSDALFNRKRKGHMNAVRNYRRGKTDAVRVNAAKAAEAIAKMVEMWLAKMNLPTSNEQGKRLFKQTIQDIIEQCCEPEPRPLAEEEKKP